MSLIDKAVDHFNSKSVRSLYIPEWESTVYAKNFAIADKAKWINAAKGDTTDYLVYACIYGLVDEQGDAIFTLEHKRKLRTQVDDQILSRMANFVLAIDNDTEEDREKN